MLSKVHEFKGEQTLFLKIHKNPLAELVKIAKIQSIEASNKMEGICTSDERLKKLVLDKTMPKTSDEFEIAGYRDVLNTIHSSYEHIPIKPSIILQLHRELYKFCGTELGGHYKISDNVIAEIDASGNKKIRFQPVPAWETSEAMEKLCEAYEEVIAEGVDPLFIIPMFILDFSCIHPFHDGNGRMSRLLTLLLLCQAGYIVGKYISIEKLIEVSKDNYYGTLYESSQNWHENENTYRQFVQYMLEVIVSTYREFSSRVNMLIGGGLSKTNRVREVIKESIGTITKADIIKKCPDISQVTIQRALADLADRGEILKISGGRYTKYIWNRENRQK